MPDQPPVKRKYDSSRRQAQARETRRQIARSARSLFIERGFDGTTIDAIAQEAGVASETVYAVFGSKRKILGYLMGTSVGGDDQRIPLLERPGPQAAMQEPDPARQLQLFSADITGILARTAPLFEVLRSAAKTDPDIAGLVERLSTERIANITAFIRQVAAHGGLREGLAIPEASELAWTLASPEVFLLLSRDRQYTPEAYASWLEKTLNRLLLP